MRTRHPFPAWPLRLFLVAGLLATTLAPVGAAAAPAAAGPGPGPGWERGVRARYAILVDPATGAVLCCILYTSPSPRDS